jgi:hypothetical protein
MRALACTRSYPEISVTLPIPIAGASANETEAAWRA